MKNILQENQPKRINDAQSTMIKGKICRDAQTAISLKPAPSNPSDGK
jgi:hypothetical protein